MLWLITNPWSSQKDQDLNSRWSGHAACSGRRVPQAHTSFSLFSMPPVLKGSFTFVVWNMDLCDTHTPPPPPPSPPSSAFKSLGSWRWPSDFISQALGLQILLPLPSLRKSLYLIFWKSRLWTRFPEAPATSRFQLFGSLRGEMAHSLVLKRCLSPSLLAISECS